MGVCVRTCVVFEIAVECEFDDVDCAVDGVAED